MTERLSRPERREIKRQDANFIERPLEVDPYKPQSAEAQIRHLVRLLQNPKVHSPCNDVVSHVHSLFDKTVPVATQGGLACSRGCSHCCYQRVTITIPEALFIASQIKNDQNAVDSVMKADELTRGKSEDERWKERVPCPFLSDDECSIYEFRPLSCRGACSLDVNECISSFVDLNDNDIGMPADHVNLMGAFRIVFLAALRIAGLDDRGFELNGAVVTALQNENAAKGWLAGESLFDSVDLDDSLPEDFDSYVQQTVDHIGPTV